MDSLMLRTNAKVGASRRKSILTVRTISVLGRITNGPRTLPIGRTTNRTMNYKQAIYIEMIKVRSMSDQLAPLDCLRCLTRVGSADETPVFAANLFEVRDTGWLCKGNQ